MDTIIRKKVAVISKYAVDTFTESDWYALGQITGELDRVTQHGRLLRALSFGDDDYALVAMQVLNSIFAEHPEAIEEVIEHFDIELWYQQKDPEKHRRLFFDSITKTPDFWTPGYLKAFVSHLSSGKEQMSALKFFLDQWGICAFIAHEDIEPSRQWRNEVEAALETMEIMVAVVQPGFKESEWCSQEVGFALGRKIEVVPVKAGLNPFGFFGKYQAIQAKGKPPSEVAQEIVSTLLRKPKHRDGLLQAFERSFAVLPSKQKTDNVIILDNWRIATDEQLKLLLERVSLSGYEKERLASIINRVGASPTVTVIESLDEDLPF